MRIADRKESKYRSPLRPFLIRTADRSEIRVSYPDAIARDAKSRSAACRSEGVRDVIDVDRTALSGDAPASPSPET